MKPNKLAGALSLVVSGVFLPGVVLAQKFSVELAEAGSLAHQGAVPDWVRSGSTYTVPVLLCTLIAGVLLLLSHRWLLVRDEARFPAHAGGWGSLWGVPLLTWFVTWGLFIGGFLYMMYAQPAYWDEFQRHSTVFGSLSLGGVVLSGLPAVLALGGRGVKA